MKLNLLKIYTKVKSQEILAEGYDKSDIPQIFELFKSQDKSTHELAMQMLYGKDDNGVPNFNVQDVEKYARKLFGVIMKAIREKNWIDLININRLDMRGKKLKDIPVGFKWLTNLHKLELDNNQLTQIPPNAFAGLTNLQRIYFDGNQLTEISSNAFAGLTNLEYISLADNQLTQIPPDAFAGLTNLEKLVLDNNPLTQIVTHNIVNC